MVLVADREAARKGAGERDDRAAALAAAVAHPVRFRCLVILTERIESKAAISRELLIDLDLVNYHVNALRKAGLVREVKNQKVRGATEHFFQSTHKPQISEAEEEAMSVSEREQVAVNILSVFVASAADALVAGTFVDRPDHHLTRHSFDLDEAGWRELVDAHMDLYRRAEAIEQAAKRRLGDKKPSLRAVSFQSAFEVPRRA